MKAPDEKTWLEELVDCFNAGFPVIELVSFEERRVEDAARDRFARLGVQFFSCSSLHDPAGALGDIEQTEEPAVLLVRDAHALLDERPFRRRIRDVVPKLAERRQGLLLLAPFEAVPAELSRELVVIDVPLPSAAELEGTALELLSGRSVPAPEGDLREIAGALAGLTLDQAARTLRKALAGAWGAGAGPVAHVLAEKKKLLRAGRLLVSVDPRVGLDDLGGLGELKRWLAERRLGFSAEARRRGLPPPRGLMLVGVQGCGKSLSARVIASAWGVPLWRLELPLVLGQAHPEAALHEALKTVDAMAPCLLWVDEIEKVFQTEASGTAARVMGSFITWLSEKETPVFTIATANEVDLLPPELVRKGRFDEIFFFDLPALHEREEILRIHLAGAGQDPARFGLQQLAAKTEYFSGSEIAQAVVAAHYRSFAAGKPLRPRDLDIAVEETVPLYRTYEEKIRGLREWARGRARPATLEHRRIGFFEQR